MSSQALPTVNSKMNANAKKTRNKIKFDIIEDRIIKKIDRDMLASKLPVITKTSSKTRRRGPKKSNTRTWFKKV